MKRFDSKRVERSHTIGLAGTPEEIFPLLCPVREEEWTCGWDNGTYELVYSESGFNEPGCIFRTSYPDNLESLWVCTKYDKETHEVEFIVDVRDLLIRKMSILLKENAGGTTDATFTFVSTATTEAGNSALEEGRGEAADTASRLGTMINHFLRTGRKLAVEGPGA